MVIKSSIGDRIFARIRIGERLFLWKIADNSRVQPGQQMLIERDPCQHAGNCLGCRSCIAQAASRALEVRFISQLSMTRHENAADLFELAAGNGLFHTRQGRAIKPGGVGITGDPAVRSGFRREVVVRLLGLRGRGQAKEDNGEQNSSKVSKHDRKSSGYKVGRHGLRS